MGILLIMIVVIRKFDHLNLIIFTTIMTLITGLGMVLTIEYIGFSNLFDFFYISSELADGLGFIGPSEEQL